MQCFLYISALALNSLGALGSPVVVPEPEVTCTAVTPAPTGCAVRGNIAYDQQDDFAVGSPQIVDNLEECASYCERRRYIKNTEYWNYFGYYDYSYQPYCKSFEYSTNTSLCTLGMLDVAKYVKPSPKSKAVYYNAECFDCGKICQQPFGDQLIDNGDFQDSLLGPWQSNKGGLSKGFQSSKAYHCAEEFSSKCFLSQEINMCKGHYYAIQFDYLSVYENQTRQTPHMMLGFGGYYYFGRDNSAAFTYNTYSKNTDRNAWKTVRGYFEYMNAEHTGPYFRFGGGGAFSLDNIYVSRVPAKPSIAASATNLFKNSGFESGDLTSWQTREFQYGTLGEASNPPFKVVKPGISGKYGVFWESTTNYDAQWSPFLAQTVVTKPNTTYLVSFDVHIPNRPFEINVFVGQSSARTRNVRRWPTGDYTFSIPVTVPTSKTLVQFEVQDLTRNNGKALMDNFSMLEIAKSAYFP